VDKLKSFAMSVPLRRLPYLPQYSTHFTFKKISQVLAEREIESKELRINISELKANTNDLHGKFEQALAHLEQESDDKDGEIAANNEEVQKFGEQVYALEENVRIREEFERVREEGGERERLEALSAALKDVRCFFLISLWHSGLIDYRNSRR
jgi:hypothetical protein